MNVPQRVSRAWRVSSWVNDISPTNWKTVVTGYMQIIGVTAFWLGWFADIIVRVLRGQPTDFHETSLGLMLGFLAGLSGFTLYGRIADRKTDYGYVERQKSGDAAIAAATIGPSPQVNTGDNAQINVAPQNVASSTEDKTYVGPLP